jgi:hypothetical protein
MKILHIMRTQPDDMVTLFIKKTSQGQDASSFPLYQEPVDYDRLVQEIFDSDRVFSWW